MKCPDCGNETDKNFVCPMCGFDGIEHIREKIDQKELQPAPFIESYLKIANFFRNKKLKGEGLTCHKCKTKNFGDVEYCENCGAKLILFKEDLKKFNLSEEMNKFVKELKK